MPGSNVPKDEEADTAPAHKAFGPLLPYFNPIWHDGGKTNRPPLADEYQEPAPSSLTPTDPVTGSPFELRCIMCSLPFGADLRLEDPLCQVVTKGQETLLDSHFGPIHQSCVGLLLA